MQSIEELFLLKKALPYDRKRPATSFAPARNKIQISASGRRASVSRSVLAFEEGPGLGDEVL